jgi:hypothetical protein
MVAVNLIVEHAEAGTPPPIWTGDLALPVIGAVIVVDGVRYEVVSHQCAALCSEDRELASRSRRRSENT